MISGKLSFQCTRNGPQNLPYCPRPIQNTFHIYSSISHQHICFEIMLQKEHISRIENLEIWKSKHPGSLTGVHKAVAKAPVAKFFTKVGAKCAPHWNCTAPAKAPPTRIVSIVAPNLAHPPAGYWGRWGGVDGGVVASNVLRNNGNLWNLYEKPWNTDCSAFGEIHFRGGYFPNIFCENKNKSRKSDICNIWKSKHPGSLTSAQVCWALVGEPRFLDFQIYRLSIFEI